VIVSLLHWSLILLKIFPLGSTREEVNGCTRTWVWSQGLLTLKSVLGGGFHRPQCVGATDQRASAVKDFGCCQFPAVSSGV
jgi:hypothetical protein